MSAEPCPNGLDDVRKFTIGPAFAARAEALLRSRVEQTCCQLCLDVWDAAGDPRNLRERRTTFAQTITLDLEGASRLPRGRW